MPALPESFDVSKRIGLLVYLSRNSYSPISENELFQNYQKDLKEFKIKLSNYRQGCANTAIRKRFDSGLVTPAGKTSFSKYLRMAHWLGLLNINLRLGEITPTWMSAGLAGIGNLYSLERVEFEVPSSIKLLLTNTVLEKDSHLILPLIRALMRTKPTVDQLSTSSFQLVYAEELKNEFMGAMKSGVILDKEYSAYSKRYMFFEKNYQLLKQSGRGTRGLKHIIEPRIHWLLDLLLVDYTTLCNDGRISPLPIWERVNISSKYGEFKSENKEMTAFYSGYIEYLSNLPFHSSAYQQRIGPSDAVHKSLQMLKGLFPEFVEIEPVVTLSWVLVNTGTLNYTSWNDLLTTLEKTHTTYRRKMSGIGFIRNDENDSPKN